MCCCDIHLHLQIDQIWSQLGDTLLGVSVDTFNEGGKSTQHVGSMLPMGLGSRLNKKKEESERPASISDTVWPASYAVFLPPRLDTVIGCDLLNCQPKSVFSSLSCFVTVARKKKEHGFQVHTHCFGVGGSKRTHSPELDHGLETGSDKHVVLCVLSLCCALRSLCFLPAMALEMTLLGVVSVSCW